MPQRLSVAADQQDAVAVSDQASDHPEAPSTPSTPSDQHFDPEEAAPTPPDPPTYTEQRPRTRLQDRTRPHVKYGCLAATGEPQNLSKALNDENWKSAMNIEVDALVKNHTWHLVPAAGVKNVIDCKWVYKIKRKADGTLDRYKARLVAK